MGQERRDGSIQSANLPTFGKLAKNKVDRDFGIYRCMVSKVNFVDDDNNLTFENLQVTYECVIIGGPKEGQILQNVKAMSDYGGEFNYAEKIYRPLETKNIKDKPISEHKGDIVYVGFLQGNNRAPVIIGGGCQPFDKTSTGAKKSDGFRMRKEYNGVFEEINKSGEWELRRKGGKLNANSGVFVPSNEFEARLKFEIGKMVWEDPNNSITIEKESQKFTHKMGSGYQEIIDGKAKKVTRIFGDITTEEDGTAKKVNRVIGDITVEEDGAAKKITATLGSVVATFDGNSNKIELKAGSTIVEIDGASGKISLKGAFVDLGASVSDFVVLFTELATAFNSHTHPFTDITPGGPVPSVTMPPLAPLLTSVGSATVKVQP